MQWVLEQNAAVTVASDRWLVTGARLKVGHHHAEFVTQTRDGKWLIDWDNLLASQRKQYGEPPESGALASEQIQLISVQT